MRVRAVVVVVATLVSTACGDDPSGLPATMSIQKAPTSSGDGQTDTVLATLASPFRVLVLRGGAPAKGVQVSWVVHTDTSLFLSAWTYTDVEGIALLTLKLGRTPNRYTVVASLPGSGKPPVTFTATATPGPPAKLLIVSGNNQTDTTQARLNVDYAVRATDNYDNGASGVAIDWAVTAGGGSITPTRGTTGSGGYAAARHTLGSSEGAQTVTATLSGLSVAPQVTFTTMAFGVGNLQLTATTTGVDLDPNGYNVTVDAGLSHRIAALAANATVTIRLPATQYRVALNDVAVNCDTTSPASRTVTVPSGGSAAAAFDVACATATLLAFVSSATGNPEIYTIKSNGTATTRLTNNLAIDMQPVWSPNGSRIAFQSRRDGNYEIYLMNADGSMPVRLTNNPASDAQPVWSPDGTEIAFVSDRDGNTEIYVMNADGTSPVRLTTNTADDADPAWSPSGSKIAFWSTRERTGEIYVMNADGSGATRLTSTQGVDAQPVWSPDGTKIVFSRFRGCDYDCGYDLYVMNADGSSATRLTSDSRDPAWSRDGRWIAVTGAVCDYYYGCYYSAVRVVRRDGSFVTELVSDGSQPAWRP